MNKENIKVLISGIPQKLDEDFRNLFVRKKGDYSKKIIELMEKEVKHQEKKR